jgi:capsular exopolysaccharide synthesis family protein
MTKLDELRLSEAQETSAWRVLEPPFLPSEPIAPKRNQNLMYGLIAGLFLGLGAAFVPELLDERLKGVEEAKEITGLPLLGAIPKAEELLDSVVAPTRETLTLGDRSFSRQYTRSPFKEALRSLALSLRYLGSSKSVKTLLFTSSIPAEGKSVITFNLGLVLAEFGRKVLVVDADMRKASLHRYLGLPNTYGLSTAIATEAPWRELVQSGNNSNLSVLTSGPMPPNPVALLNSERMEELIAEWRQHYDYVLIDTPPVTGLPDAQSLLNRVDRVLFVTGIERSTRSVLTRAVEILRTSQANVAGIIVNLLSESNDGYYYQYYSSYYLAEDEEGEGGQAGRKGRKSGGLLGLFRR